MPCEFASEKQIPYIREDLTDEFKSIGYFYISTSAPSFAIRYAEASARNSSSWKISWPTITTLGLRLSSSQMQL
jgi:hypothetical protein